MKTKDMTEAEAERLFSAYESLIDWVQSNRVDGQETLGLLLKASGALAVMNHLPKEQLMEVLSVTYDIESLMRSHSPEVH